MGESTKSLALISIVAGTILSLSSILVMVDLTDDSHSSDDPQSAAAATSNHLKNRNYSPKEVRVVEAYGAMAAIAIGEFGLFIGITQLLFSALLYFSGKSAFEALEPIWLSYVVGCLFALATCFALSLGWTLNSSGPGRAFSSILALDFCATAVIVATWFSIQPPPAAAAADHVAH